MARQNYIELRRKYYHFELGLYSQEITTLLSLNGVDDDDDDI